MNIIRQMCGNCAGTGEITQYITTTLKHGGIVMPFDKEECYACGGKGYTEYAMFTMEEAQAILKHCGIITGEIGDI